MPRDWRPAPRTGKQPPTMLLRGMEMLVDLGDGVGWPRRLAPANDSGLPYPCAMNWGYDTANEPNLGPPRCD